MYIIFNYFFLFSHTLIIIFIYNNYLYLRHAFLNIYRMLRLGGMAVLWFKTESDIPEIIETLRNDERFKNDFTMVNIITAMLC